MIVMAIITCHWKMPTKENIEELLDSGTDLIEFDDDQAEKKSITML